MKKGFLKNGFTIIEVVLVLAIAGLIFIMVFVALPALQRSQRDSARRDAMMSFIDDVKTYQNNNRGALPKMDDDSVVVSWDKIKDDDKVKSTDANWAGFYKGYLDERFQDPDGYSYKLNVLKCGQTTDAVCDGLDTALYDKTFPNDYSMVVVVQSKCGYKDDGMAAAVGSSNPRNLSVLYRLEGSGIYCYPQN